MAEKKETPPPPLPVPTLVSQPFWEAANEGRLVLQFDRATGKPQFWPRPLSVQSGRADTEWREVSGKGTVYASTIVHVAARGFEDRVPYTLVSVDLAEGGRITGQLVNTEDPPIPGMAVRVTWERRSDDINVYAFEPDV